MSYSHATINRRPPLPPPRVQNKVAISCGLNRMHIIFPPFFKLFFGGKSEA